MLNLLHRCKKFFCTALIAVYTASSSSMITSTLSLKMKLRVANEGSEDKMLELDSPSPTSVIKAAAGDGVTPVSLPEPMQCEDTQLDTDCNASI